MTKQELEEATKLGLRSAEATKAVLAEIDAKNAEIESLTAALAAMREVLEKIADGPCTAPPYHDENDCPNFTGKRKVCNRCKVRLFLRQSDAGSKLMERHREEVAKAKDDLDHWIGLMAISEEDLRDQRAAANQRAEAAEAEVGRLKRFLNDKIVALADAHERAEAAEAQARELHSQCDEERSELSRLIGDALNRAKAAEAALLDMHRERNEYAALLTAAVKRADCPPSGILQEWQPWNGR